ncbi:DUF1302 family protein [Salinivirga cyanobacteriivorans]
MKYLKIIFSIAAALLLTLPAFTQNIDINGYARNYTGVLTDNGDFSILQNTLDLNFERRGDKSLLKANPMLYSYGTDSLNFQLRELYLDLYFKNFDLRIGKQQVVWGKADGVFITDIVSPLDLSEFLLPDFREIRQGVTAAKLNYYIGTDILELIWIPQFTATQMPSGESIWYQAPDFPAPAIFDWSQSEIEPTLENSEFFAKYSALTSKIDFEIMGGYTWDDNPAMHIEKQFDMSSGQPELTGLKVTPEHHRLTLAGGSFSTEIGGVIFRGEGAYYHGKYLNTTDPAQTDALVKKDYVHYLGGIDFTISDINFSTQFIQEALINYTGDIEQEEFDNTMTFLAQYDMLHETLNLELFTYLGLNNEDALIRPKVTYDFEDGFSILVGANIFIGNKDGRFGQYRDNSMVYTKIKYNF